MENRQEEGRFRWLTAAALVVAGLLAYANSFTGEFVWDDVSSILLHRHVQDPRMAGQLFREDFHAFGRGQGNFYRPLLAVTFMVDYALSHKAGAIDGIPEVSAFLFHASNTAWHIGVALLLFALLTRLGAPRFVRAAAPLVYIVHPLHTEAVTYISGRGDSLAAFFMLAAAWFALWEGTRARQVAGAALCGVCFACAMLSKESALIFPVFLVPLLMAAPACPEGEPRGRLWRRRALPLGISAALLPVYAWLRMTVLHFGSDSGAPESGLGRRLVETAQAFALYVRVIVAPTGLHMERTLTGTPGWVAVVGALLLAGCLAATVWALWSGRSRVAAGLAWFLITWFPISGLIPLNAPMAEHWLYVPLAGLLWAVFEVVEPVTRGPRGRAALTAAVYGVTACFIGMTVLRNRDWHDNESLYLATLARNPESTRVHYNLAVTYEVLLDNPAGARRHYRAVTDIYERRRQAQRPEDGPLMYWDDELEAHLSLGNIGLELQEPARAAEHYAVLLSVQATQTNARKIAMAALGMGRCQAMLGRPEEAQRFFARAVQLAPELEARLREMGAGAL